MWYGRICRKADFMKFPFFKHLVDALQKKPATNPFPAKHLPLPEEAAAVHPAVPAPESSRMRLLYNSADCIGCQMCIKVCSAHAIDMLPDVKKVRVFRSQCIACGQCTEVCPKNCLSMDNYFLQADADRYSPELVVD